MINVRRYRDPWMAEKFDDFIGFYNREFDCLSNFSSFAIIYNGVKYLTLEHAYQAHKFINTNTEVYNKIVNCLSAEQAQKIAISNKESIDPNWDNIKVSIMEKLLRIKLEQNPYVVSKLLETKDYLICEDSPFDTFWGIGQNRDGQNQLGKLWMKLRDELKDTKQ